MKKTGIFTSFLAFFILFSSYNGQLRAQEPFEVSFDHLALSVKDIKKSAAFYTDILMLPEITNLSGKEGMRWFSLSNGRELHIIRSNKEKIIMNDDIHFAFTSNSFDAILKVLISLKIPYSDADGKPNTVSTRADGIKQIYFQDPDGYWLEANSVGEIQASVKQIENEVWQREMQCGNYVKNNDLQGYLTLWHNNFIGYSGSDTLTRKNIGSWINESHNKKDQRYEFKITKKAVNVFGDVAVVLYDVQDTWKNSKGEVVLKELYKITHTWKKFGSTWLIIGGMSALKKE